MMGAVRVCSRAGVAAVLASLAAVVPTGGSAWAVDVSQPTLNRGAGPSADLGVFRSDPNGGDISWIWSSGETDLWGRFPAEDTAGGDIPVLGDFDGDTRNDPTVVRPGGPSTWFIKGTASGQRALQFGETDDQPVSGDFDGDGKADLAVVRTPDGGGALTWYIARSTGGVAVFTFGDAADDPVPANYVGGQASDIAVRRYEPDGTTAIYILNTTGRTERIAWGQHLDQVVRGDYDNDGRTDVSVVRQVPVDPAAPDGDVVLRWFLRLSAGGQVVIDHGSSTKEHADFPVAADYTGDGRTDIGVVRYPEREPGELVQVPLEWYVRSSTTGTTTRSVFGQSTDSPVAFG